MTPDGNEPGFAFSGEANLPYQGEMFALMAALAWSIGVVLFKRLGETMSPMSMNLFKNIFGLLMFAPTFFFIGDDAFAHHPLHEWVLFACSGFLGIAVADTLFFIALEKLGAGLTAVVDTAYAPIMLLLSLVWLDERLSTPALLGALFILLALLLSAKAEPNGPRQTRDLVYGVFFCVLAMFFMGVSVVIIKPFLRSDIVFWVTWVRLSGGTVGLVAMMGISRKRRALFEALRPSPTWKLAIPASFFGTYLATTGWIAGFTYVTEVSRAALLNQLSTLFIFVLAIVFLKEPLTTRRIVALLLAVPGAVLVALN